MAAIEAFNSPESDRAVERMVGEFQRRRDLMVDGLNRIPGFRCVRPDGAFYAFPNVEGTGIDEKELADRLLQEAGVAVLPGTAFGSAGKGYLRLAYTQSDAAIGEALRRMEAFLRQNSEGGRP
jgi:aspartate/methionine/tyrosine aminotransferase